MLSAGVAAKRWWFRDSSHAVTVDAALEKFRSATTLPSPTSDVLASTSPTVVSPSSTEQSSEPLTLPAVGVYRYATTGFEAIDAFGGARHDYPAETTLTVTVAGCGVDLRWDPLKERSEQWQLCITDRGIEWQATGSNYHQFFGQDENEQMTCDHSAVLVPTVAPPEIQQLDCHMAGHWLPQWWVLERTTRVVEGVDVPVQHVRLQVTDTDKYFELITVEWYLDDHGLPVHVDWSKESLAETKFGDVKFSEHFTLALQSLTPLT